MNKGNLEISRKLLVKRPSFVMQGIERIVETYNAFKDEPGFARVATLEEIRAKDGSLSIPLYVAPQATEAREERAGYAANGLPGALSVWLASSAQVRASLQGLFDPKKR